MEPFFCFMVVFYLILMVVGIPGNLLIILVTASRITKKSVHVFIIALASADLLACCLLPFGVHYWLTFNDQRSSILCKIHIFTNYLGVFTSMFLTNAIAFDRYFAVCHPLKTFLNVQRSYVVCVGCFVCAFLCSVPSVFAFGIYLVPDLGSICTVLVNTWLVRSIFGIIVFTFVLSATVLIILYLHICIILRRQAHFRARVAPTPTPVQDEAQPTSNGIQTISDKVPVASCSSSRPETRCIKESLKASNPSTSRSVPTGSLLKVPTMVRHAWYRGSSQSDNTPRLRQLARHRENNNATAVAKAMRDKTTKMLILASTVFIASWLPNIIIKSLSSRQYDRLKESHPAVILFIRSAEFLFLLNHAVNPFVYSLVNKRFRVVCVQYIQNLRRKWIN